MHVDHIKPKSTHPHLALVKSNMQVLCEDCNMGKSNRDATDFRDPSWNHSDGMEHMDDQAIAHMREILH